MKSPRVMASPVATGRGQFIARYTSSKFLHEHYEEQFELGRGSYGRVSMVRDRRTGQKRVCKIVNIASMTAFEVGLAKREIQLYCELDHPRVVRLYEYAEDEESQQLVLILEYLSGGDCLRLVRGGAQPEEALVARIISQVLLTLGHCHQQGIVHRDVKLDNLMLGSVPLRGQPDCRLIDFGFSARSSPLPMDILGTPAYMAPEVRRGEGYTPKADVWSLGVCALELLSGLTPFGKPADFGGSSKPILESAGKYRDFSELDVLLQTSRSWATRSAQAKDFVRWMLAGVHGQRPSVAEALRHPWLQEHQPRADVLSDRLLESFVAFARAPTVTQHCLYVLAARTDVGEKEMRQIIKAFEVIDANGDGQISVEELARAVRWGLRGKQVDGHTLFSAMDVNRSGAVSFTDVVAASLTLSFASPEDVFSAAFHALDEERRGLFSVSDVQRAFPKCGPSVWQHLPCDRTFDLSEWVKLAVACCSTCRPIRLQPMRMHSAPGITSRGSPEQCEGSYRLFERQAKHMESQIDHRCMISAAAAPMMCF